MRMRIVSGKCKIFIFESEYILDDNEYSDGDDLIADPDFEEIEYSASDFEEIDDISDEYEAHDEGGYFYDAE